MRKIVSHATVAVIYVLLFLCVRQNAEAQNATKTEQIVSPAVAGGDFHITDVGQKTYLGGKPDVGRAMQNRPPLPPLAASVPPPKNGDAVCLTESNGEAFLKALSALFPAEPETVRRLFPAEGTHLRLRTSANGSCVFQGRDGCRLPRSVRPWYCLLFPGWVQRNAVALFVADNCLAAARAKSPEQGLRLLGVTPEEIFALYDALRNDWGL